MCVGLVSQLGPDVLVEARRIRGSTRASSGRSSVNGVPAVLDDREVPAVNRPIDRRSSRSSSLPNWDSVTRRLLSVEDRRFQSPV